MLLSMGRDPLTLLYHLLAHRELEITHSLFYSLLESKAIWHP